MHGECEQVTSSVTIRKLVDKAAIALAASEQRSKRGETVAVEAVPVQVWEVACCGTNHRRCVTLVCEAEAGMALPLAPK